MSKERASVVRPRFAVTVENGKLVAGGPYEQECIDRLPRGRIMVEVDEEEPADGVRNMIFAGIGLLYDNLPDTGPGKTFPTKEHLRRALLRGIGLAEPIHRVDGIKLEAASMARDKMGFDELQTVLELMRVHCFERFGFDPFELWTSQQDELQRGRR